MIRLHRLGHRDAEPVHLNPDLILMVEATPDTVVTLSTHKKLIVAETPEEIAALVLEFRRRATSRPQVLRGSDDRS